MGVERDTVTIFSQRAADYDAWYDTPAGAGIFADELAALRPLVADFPHPWLEVGTGPGRFAAALGVDVGIDPADALLRLARRRGYHLARARGEALPFAAGAFGAALVAMTLCFVTDRRAAVHEIERVLRPGGGAVLGIVPAEGPWGRHYRRLAAAGRPFYREARFWTRDEVRALLVAARLTVVRVRSALYWLPDAPAPGLTAREGDDPAAGFVAWLAVPRAGAGP